MCQVRRHVSNQDRYRPRDNGRYQRFVAAKKKYARKLLNKWQKNMISAQKYIYNRH